MLHVVNGSLQGEEGRLGEGGCVADEFGFAFFRCQTLNHVYASSCRRLSKVLWRGLISLIVAVKNGLLDPDMC